WPVHPRSRDARLDAPAVALLDGLRRGALCRLRGVSLHSVKLEIVRLHLAHMESLNNIPVHGFVIKHPRAGAILVDSGVGWGNDRLIREWRGGNRHAAGAMDAPGLSPADVEVVLNSAPPFCPVCHD